MLVLEHSRHQQFVDQVYDLEQSIQAPYPSLAMDPYETVDPMMSFHPLPYSYFENPSIFSTAQVQIKQEMHQMHDFSRSAVSSASAPSIPSASSSTVGSPYSGPSHTISSQDGFEQHAVTYGLGVMPTIVNHEAFPQEFGISMESELPIHSHEKLSNSFVDPSLIHAPQPYGEASYPEQALFPPNLQSYSSLSPSGSPALSPQPYNNFAPTQFADPMTNPNFYQQQAQLSRRPSLASYVSGGSRSSPVSEFDEEGREKGRCPHADCGKVFKDLKAHMLTHQSERPEKCPILTCEYNQKGFARKYDKNRHTLTHYKGTMVCGFCPGSGSPAEKSFNRADVFKRHLTSVHGVEQTPPNSRKRSPASNHRKLSSYCQDATGKCSTCSQTFNNAQDFYEHLDDCVLRVVQQEEPSEAINAQHLAAMSSDSHVQETMDLHMIKTEEIPPMNFDEEDEEEDDDDDEDDEGEDPSFHGRSGKGSIKSHKHPAQARAVIGAGVSKGKASKKGMTWSKGGVALAGKGRKKRKHYPPSWGMSAEKMRMKKRVLCVYDGDRRLWKDDMMLHNEFEVRMTLPDGKNYVTDLDVETMKRAVAFHNATEEEKGPWLPTAEEDAQGYVDLNALMAI
ncbi:uncharacterized protein A1O9_04358 [Exophiala aquamarina CBS 119918]|uniref:C2H2-type domain-containing protein n=1 Tax=Exophiala aquamarina CBS 119918 TaxID=1182545 RepID=A0A072PHA4_9EURO|nr:uncharacterized protein A1O9_04358 [Exophiala aquamarina CBS 119918]KEF59514.1 hypothetical protein A1O9_04358 [Exophiala aquamarina CBS 119918]